MVATRPGLGSGTIVVVSHRDSLASPGEADLSGTAVLVGLADALSGETLSRSVMLISTSGQIGSAGAAQLAQSLSGQQLDGVIVLGDLAAETVHSPVIVPWSSTDKLAPAVLTRTLGSYLGSETGINSGSEGFAGQVARLAFPFSITEQAPFAGSGIGAALLSLSGDRPVSGHEKLASSSRTASLGMAVLQTVNSLDHGRAIGSPSGYLTISGQLVPLWAVRLLVLVLILPVAAATLDSVARARRRGHKLMRWLGWVLLTGAMPFVLRSRGAPDRARGRAAVVYAPGRGRRRRGEDDRRRSGRAACDPRVDRGRLPSSCARSVCGCWRSSCPSAAGGRRAQRPMRPRWRSALRSRRQCSP